MKMTEEWFDLTFNPISTSENDWQIDISADLSEVDPKKIWTVLDNDGVLWLSAGYHFVNRMYYVVTKEARTEDWQEEIEVCLEFEYSRSEVIDKMKQFLVDNYDAPNLDPALDELLDSYF